MHMSDKNSMKWESRQGCRGAGERRSAGARGNGIRIAEYGLRTAAVAPLLALLFGLLAALPVFAVERQPGAANRPASYTLQITPTATSTATPTPTVIPTNTSTPFPPILITAIEPGRISSETGGQLSVYGNGFTPGSVIRIFGVGLIPTTYVNAEAVVGQVPPGLSTGFYDIQVGLGDQDGPNAVARGVLEIFGPTPTPVPTDTSVPTATAVYVFGQPQLAIQSAVANPAAPLPGQPFELEMVLANLGNWTAIDVSLALQSTDVAVPAAGSNVRILPRIGVEAAITVTLPLVLSPTAPDGPQNLTFNIDYFDLNGRAYSTQQSVGLAVSDVTATPTPGPEQPRLVLTTYGVEPEGALQPGSVFDLTLALSNVGSADAENVIVTLGGANGEQLAPFALVNAGNIRFIETIPAGETVTVRQAMLVAGTANAGVYNLPVGLSFDGADASGAQVINLLVERPPLLQANFYRPVPPGQVGQPLDLPVEVVNIGRSQLNVSTLSITSADMQVENNSIYVGPLDGGTSGSLDAIGIPQRGGALAVLVTVNYLDDFNQPQIYEETLTVQVAEPVDAGEEVGETAVADETTENGGFLDLLWRFIRGMLGLGS